MRRSLFNGQLVLGALGPGPRAPFHALFMYPPHGAEPVQWPTGPRGPCPSAQGLFPDPTVNALMAISVYVSSQCGGACSMANWEFLLSSKGWVGDLGLLQSLASSLLEPLTAKGNDRIVPMVGGLRQPLHGNYGLLALGSYRFLQWSLKCLLKSHTSNLYLPG